MKLVSSRKKTDYSNKCSRFHVTLGWELVFFPTAAALVITLLYLSGTPPKSQENHEYVNPETLNRDDESGVEIGQCQIPSLACAASSDYRAGNQEDSGREISNNFYKDKRDLNAQEGVWRASNVTAFYSFVMAALTALGVWLLFLTLRATQKAIELSRETVSITQDALSKTQEATDAAIQTAEAAESAERAQIVVQVSPVFCGPPDPPHMLRSEFKLEITINNFGKSPALNVKCCVHSAETAPSRYDNRMNIWKEFDVIGPSNGAEIPSLPIYGSQSMLTVDGFNRVEKGITAEWTYDDIFGTTRYGKIVFRFDRHTPANIAGRRAKAVNLLRDIRAQRNTEADSENVISQIVKAITEIRVEPKVVAINQRTDRPLQSEHK